ncbi:hypothetical protein [Streptomyces regalis]|uniref:Uncharacterized protein n=1 Tax=Streptomyces regalis TaxID=68262 RepID=A0A117MP83_9ACTN|nr:hypothetical protein [Streptomyces regalis]KUL28227.1 hypothetical protein ADL12_28775 [Streptomyces regalis]
MVEETGGRHWISYGPKAEFTTHGGLREDKATREGRENSLDQYEELGVDELTLDVWVDGDDRVKAAPHPGLGPICSTATVSRTLLQKPKTAGRCRALARGCGGRRIR